MNLTTEIDRLSQRIIPLANFINVLAASVDQPQFHKGETQRGFRFENPRLVHFLCLRGVRIVSGLNASIELARSGFSQEIAVLLRTQVEHTTQIDFMLTSRGTDGQLSKKAEAFLVNYFEDVRRPPNPGTKRLKLVQKEVHKIVGARLDKEADEVGVDEKAESMRTNYFQMYTAFFPISFTGDIQNLWICLEVDLDIFI